MTQTRFNREKLGFWTDADAVAWFKAQYFDTSVRLGKQYIKSNPSASFYIRKHHRITVRLDNYGRHTVTRID